MSGGHGITLKMRAIKRPAPAVLVAAPTGIGFNGKPMNREFRRQGTRLSARTEYRAQVRARREQILEARADARAQAALRPRTRFPANTLHALTECSQLPAPDGPAQRRRARLAREAAAR